MDFIGRKLQQLGLLKANEADFHRFARVAVFTKDRETLATFLESYGAALIYPARVVYDEKATIQEKCRALLDDVSEYYGVEGASTLRGLRAEIEAMEVVPGSVEAEKQKSPVLEALTYAHMISEEYFDRWLAQYLVVDVTPAPAKDE
jgi:hypothetical protein